MRYCAAAEQRAHAGSNLFLYLPWIVGWSDVLDAEKPFAVYLNDSFLRRPRVMFHASRYRRDVRVAIARPAPSSNFSPIPR